MAKGSFPGCLRKKIVRKRIKNSNHRNSDARWDRNQRIAQQILENLQRFRDVFGNSDEDDEFHGFSSEECGLIAYKHVNSSHGRRSIRGILSSPIDLTARNVTTRLAHARRSFGESAMSQKTKGRKQKALRKTPAGEDGFSTDSVPVLPKRDPGNLAPHASGFIKYNNSNLDFHRLSENATFQCSVPSKQSSTLKHKSSPIKPATFIAPSLAKQGKHQVTNVTPTCLKIQIGKKDKTDLESAQPSLLVRHGKSKVKSFQLPAKSSRSSRIIKANPKYFDNADKGADHTVIGNTAMKCECDSPESVSKETSGEPKLGFYSVGKATKEMMPDTNKKCKDEGRLLLKQPTFRVAALAKINDKPQTSRLLTKNSGISTRMRARKLIKRARFKHPTSSSTLVVGNDYDEDEMKKNLIREATFKMPNKSQEEVKEPLSKGSVLSDLGLSVQTWKKLGKNEIHYRGDVSPWTRQEIHNLLHGAHTFANSWRRIARHYEYQSLHRDWQSIKAKLKTLQNFGLLSSNLKVKSTVLLQLKHRYSTNPNVTVFTQQELKSRGMNGNVECEANSVREEDEDVESQSSQPARKGSVSMQKYRYHIQCYKKWADTLSTDPPNSHSIYLGLEKTVFTSLCIPQRLSVEQEPWSVREIHNIVHGFYIFGMCEWSMVHKLYVFQKTHDATAIRTRFKIIKSKGIIAHGKVKSEVLQLLQPLLSVAGKKYYELSPRAGLVSKSTRRQGPSEVAKRNWRRPARKKSKINDNDLKSPPRKQAYHLFGTAPVWDESSTASGLNRLEDSNSGSEDEVKQESGVKRKSRKLKKDTCESLSKKRRSVENSKTATSSRGPRIKHVCRRASLVTGQRIAMYNSDETSDLHLSALPKKEREKIAAELEKNRGATSDTTLSSDSEDVDVENVKQSVKKSDRLAKIVGRKRTDKERNRARCKMCTNCKSPKCGICDYCKDSSGDCLGLPPCLNPPEITNIKNGSKKSVALQKQGATSCMETRKTAAPCLYERQPDAKTSSGPVGILLSPESRRRLQQELQEHARLSPSIVKIDDWKERYELDDLWTAGGVSIITSTTPSTRFLCFLCGSVGRARPMRRSSIESDSSADSVDNFDQKPLFIFCCSCCEPFHPFCLEDHEQQPAICSAKKGTWICKRCRFCNVCGRTDNLLECKRCSKTYHSNCLGPGYPNKQSKNRVWVCMRCVRCRSCGASKPGRRPGSKWTHDFQLCQRCGDLFDKGNFCPICRRCYRDEDYESRMVQCGTCKRWVHSRCESLTNEMYALLSHLPDDVQYVCPDCDGRRSKVEIEFSNSCENVLTDDISADNSLEGDKMKNMLQDLPSPPWKNILENEVQSGIESVMMALFHSKETACILKKVVVQENSDVSRPVDLFAVRFAVHNRRYSSVSQFSSDVCCILDTLTDENSSDVQPPSQGRKKRQQEGGPRNAFSKEMLQVFPWFDIETGRVRDTSDVPEDLLPHATLPPHPDHNYAQWQDRDIAISTIAPETPLKDATSCETSADTDSIGMVVWSLMSNSEFDDRRQCLFCGKYGDDVPTVAGRLVYCGQDEWVHVNCALWSAEVFERHDGSLQNVYSAVSRGRMMKCELCKLPGATVGCNTRDCPQNFHFACAKIAQCNFQNDKKVFCPKHAINIDGELVTEEGFEVARRVVVDSDEMRPNKRWQRGVKSDNVTILMGSAIIHQIGHLTLASDSREYLTPVHFRMTRMFWSTVQAGRKVRYTITVTEQKSTFDTEPSSKSCNETKEEKMEHGNHTISHGDERELTNKTGYRDATPCKSNLLSRLHDAESNVQERRKSFDEPGPKAPRSRRFSGPAYTVVGLFNRTMPQNITPLPSSLVTTPARQQQHMSTKPAANSHLLTASIDKDAVVVSPLNPYLNIELGQIKQTMKHTQPHIQTDILKAMDQCVMNTCCNTDQITTAMSPLPKIPPSTEVVLTQTTINHGSSGSLLNKCNNTAPETNIKKTNDNTDAVEVASDILAVVNPVEPAGKSRVEPEKEPLNTPTLIVTSETKVAVNSGGKPSCDDSGLHEQQNFEHTKEKLIESSTLSVCDDTSHSDEKNIHTNKTVTSKQDLVEQISDANTTVDEKSGGNRNEGWPVVDSTSQMQDDEDPNNFETLVIRNYPKKSSKKPHTIKLSSKSKKSGEVTDITTTTSPNSVKDHAENSSTTNSSPASGIMTRLRNSDSFDSLSGEVYMESISCEDEKTPHKLHGGSVRELKVILHDINDMDASNVKGVKDRSKSLSEELLGRKDELFTDSVRSSDSSSIDSGGVSDMHCSADANRKRPQARKRRLRDFARNGKSANGNEFKLITRSKKHFISSTSGKVTLHDGTVVKSKGGASNDTSNRLRSRSEEAPRKMKQLNQENARRYPRRNPFTCLRSFSGLSPNYAIQSYSLKTSAKHDHSTSQRVKTKNENVVTEQSRKKSKTAAKNLIAKRTDCDAAVNFRKTARRGTFGMTSKKVDALPITEKTQVGNVRRGRSRGRSFEFSQKPSSNDEPSTNLKNVQHAELPCEIDADSITVTSPCETDSTSDKATLEAVTDTKASLDDKQVLPICDKQQKKNVDESDLQDQEDMNDCVSDKLRSVSDVTAEDELPPIEQERGIIETEPKTPPVTNFDDSDTEAVNVKPKDMSRPPVATSPITVINSDISVQSSEETIRKIASDHSCTSGKVGDCESITMAQMTDADKALMFSDVRGCESIPTVQISNTKNIPDLSVLQHQPHVVSKTTPLTAGLNVNAFHDIESPLSPRDEPNLPPPVETEATASTFLVTSECPVLNVDEVQSILAMPPTRTVMCTSASNFPITIVTPASTNIGTADGISKMSILNACQPAQLHQTPQMPIQQHFVPLNVRTYDSQYQETPKVLMKYDGKQAYLLCSPQPVLNSPQPVLNSPQTVFTCPNLQTPNQITPTIGVAAQPQIKTQPQAACQYMQSNLTPVIQSQPVYVAKPMVCHASDMAVETSPQSQQFQYPVSKSLPLQVIIPSDGVAKSHKILQATKQPESKNAEEVASGPVSMPSTQAPAQESLPAEGYPATVSQLNTLEKMIEFYSNKNNLSTKEKQIVRAIIAQHIRNQSLPLPTPDDLQIPPVSSGSSATDTNKSVKKGKKRTSKSTKESQCKRAKRLNHKDSSRFNPMRKSVTETSDTGSDSQLRSPLLDIYMKVMHAENSCNDKLVKHWRERIRHLMKYHISLEIPFYSRRSSKDKQSKLPPPPPTPKHSELVYEITSEDGYHAKGSNLRELVSNLLDAVQECRSDAFIPPNSLCLASVISPQGFLGVSQDAVRFLVEQLHGAKHCQRYKAKYYKQKKSIPEVVTHINPHGCARAEKYQGRSKPDMFSFLASKHRVPPTYDPSQTQNVDMQQNSTRRPTSMDLPMAMRFRHLKTFSREAVGVYRSAIHGRGLFCKRDIEAGEMVMEYTGEVIRCFLTDSREKMYESKGIGCYMFRMDDTFVIDATMTGSGARFINHSCEPSCYSRIVSIDGRKHIIIFALRKILRGEELTYDYKFPIEAEDQKIMCNCGSKTCRKFMN